MFETEMIKIASSKIQGVGVFAKKAFKKGELIHIDIALWIPESSCTTNSLEDYVYDGPVRYTNWLIMGAGSFLNGKDDEDKVNVTVSFYSADELVEEYTPTKLEHFNLTDDHKMAVMEAHRDIAMGEELILEYDGDNRDEDEE